MGFLEDSCKKISEQPFVNSLKNPIKFLYKIF